jgi:hypothetical protein
MFQLADSRSRSCHPAEPDYLGSLCEERPAARALGPVRWSPLRVHRRGLRGSRRPATGRRPAMFPSTAPQRSPGYRNRSHSEIGRMPRSRVFGNGCIRPHFHVPTPGRSPLNSLSDLPSESQNVTFSASYMWGQYPVASAAGGSCVRRSRLDPRAPPRWQHYCAYDCNRPR